jgi:hypothetical protein
LTLLAYPFLVLVGDFCFLPFFSLAGGLIAAPLVVVIV